MKANQRVPQNKFEGVTDRNFTTYNPQVVRDDVFMLARDGEDLFGQGKDFGMLRLSGQPDAHRIVGRPELDHVDAWDGEDRLQKLGREFDPQQFGHADRP